MVPEHLEYLADVLALKCGQEFGGLEKLIPHMRGWSPELVAEFPVTLAAQAGGVVGGKRRTAPLAAAAATAVSSVRARRTHRIPHNLGTCSRIALTSVHTPRRSHWRSAKLGASRGSCEAKVLVNALRHP